MTDGVGEPRPLDIAGRPEQGHLAFRLGAIYLGLCAVPALAALPGGVSGGQALMLASLPVWFHTAARREKPVFDPFGQCLSSLIVFCCLSLFILSVFSAFIADTPLRTARPAVSLLTGPVLLLLMVATATPKRIYAYVAIMCLAAAATGLLSLLATFVPPMRDLVFGDSDRASGFFKNPNQFGIVIAAILPITLAMAFASTRRRVLWWAALVIMLASLMLSGSKMNLLLACLTLPVSLLLFVWIRYSGPARIVMSAITLFSCALAGGLSILALSFLNPRALRLLNEAVVEGENTHSLVARSTLWKESIQVFLDNPLLGAGAGQPVLGFTHSHNLLLDYARTLGLPGLSLLSLLIFLVVVGSLSQIILAARTKEGSLQDRFLCIGLAMGPMSYLGSNMSSDSFGPTTSPYFFATLAFGIAARGLLFQSRHRNKCSPYFRKQLAA